MGYSPKCVVYVYPLSASMARGLFAHYLELRDALTRCLNASSAF